MGEAWRNSPRLLKMTRASTRVVGSNSARGMVTVPRRARGRQGRHRQDGGKGRERRGQGKGEQAQERKQGRGEWNAKRRHSSSIPLFTWGRVDQGHEVREIPRGAPHLPWWRHLSPPSP